MCSPADQDDTHSVEHRVEPHHALYSLLSHSLQLGFRHFDDFSVSWEKPGTWNARLEGREISANYGPAPDPHLLVTEMITDPNEQFLFALQSTGIYAAHLLMRFAEADFTFLLWYANTPRNRPLRLRRCDP